MTSDASYSATDPFVGRWILLFPATYLVHIAEEHWGGFSARAAEMTGLVVPAGAFLTANAVFWVLMVVAVVLILQRPSRAPLVVALATIVTINATIHVGAALLTRSYAPGLVSGVLFWFPLGFMALTRGHRNLPPRAFRVGVLIGVVAHALVPIVGLGSVLALGGGWRAV